MPAQASLVFWPSSDLYTLLPLLARKPRTSPVGLPACAAHSAYFPRLSPTSGCFQLCHHAMCRRRPPSRTRVKSNRSVGSSPSSLPSRRCCQVSSSPLTLSKPIGIKTPPLPAASPTPHCLPGPIKRAPALGQLHHAHPHSPLFTSSPRAPRTPSTALLPPVLPRQVIVP
jgi:hypothetical protein